MAGAGLSIDNFFCLLDNKLVQLDLHRNFFMALVFVLEALCQVKTFQ